MSLARASVLSLGVRGTSVALGIAITVLLARVLGADAYGGYLYLLNIALLLVTPSVMGVSVLLTRQIATYQTQRQYGSITGIILWSFGFLGATTLTVMVASYGLNAIFDLVVPAVVPALVGLAVLVAVQRLATAILYGYQQPLRAVLSEAVIRPAVHLAIIGALAVFGTLTVFGTFAAYAVGMAAAIAFAVWHVRKVYRPTRSTSGRLLARIDHRVWLGSVGALGAISIAATINLKLDIIMLGAISTNTEVAVYGVALQMIGMVFLVRNTILGIAGPRFAGLWAQRDMAGIDALVLSVNRLNLAGAITLSVLLFFVAEPLLAWLISDTFSASGTLAIISSINVVFIALLGPSTILLTMCGEERLFLKATLAMVVVNVTLNLILIPQYGAFGALVASISSELLLQVGCLWYCRRTLGINTIRIFR